jgi:hypothetical protein
MTLEFVSILFLSHPRYHAQGIPAILNAIRSAADTRATAAGTVELITEGVNLLAAIASNQECRPLIMQHGGIEITLQVMRFYIDFPLIQDPGSPGSGVRCSEKHSDCGRTGVLQFHGGCSQSWRLFIQSH